jgi:IS5 family transposase
VNPGSIVDATIVNVPMQRDSRDENKDIKNGKTPQDWEENTAKKR